MGDFDALYLPAFIRANILVIYKRVNHSDCQGGGKKRFVCAPTSHGCRSVVMQACKYVALRWAWAVMLDDVIQRLLEYVISSLSLSLSRFLGNTRALNQLWRRGKTSSLDRSSSSSAMTVSIA